MNSPLEQLELRLLKLEEQNSRLAKSNRVFKSLNISIVLVAFCLVAIGWKAQSNVADVIEAKRFVLKDENGKIFSEWKIVGESEKYGEMYFGSSTDPNVLITQRSNIAEIFGQIQVKSNTSSISMNAYDLRFSDEKDKNSHYAKIEKKGFDFTDGSYFCSLKVDDEHNNLTLGDNKQYMTLTSETLSKKVFRTATYVWPE
jgi:hypothetical protein